MSTAGSTTVRLAQPGDAKAIASVHIASTTAAYANVIPQAMLANQSIDKEEKVWQAILSKNPGGTLVALDKTNEIVGFVGFGPSRSRDNEAEIYAIYNRPDYFRSGTGRLLWEAARSQIIDSGLTKVMVWVVTENEPSRRFYESIGFTLVPGSDSTFTWLGQSLNEICYECDLQTET